MNEEIIRLQHIYKSYLDTEVLHDVNINLFKGEVLGLIGGNGAGKSTIVGILTGECLKKYGDIYFMEEKIEINSPNDSQRYGIVCVPQSTNLIDSMSIIDNIYFIRQYNRPKLYLYKKMKEKTARLLELVNLNYSPNHLIQDLDIIEKKKVEFAKALSFNPKIIILDEITAYMNDADKDWLNQQISFFKKQGLSFIVISHNINEIIALCDRVSVLKDGNLIMTIDTKKTNSEVLSSIMFGNKFNALSFNKVSFIGKETLKVIGISAGKRLKNVSLTLHRGEILGIKDNGDSRIKELIGVLFGLVPIVSGEISLNGNRIKINNPRDAVKHGIGFIDGINTKRGLIPDFTAAKNITFGILHKICRGNFFVPSFEKLMEEETMEKVTLPHHLSNRMVCFLSGGTQQKVLLGKWLATKCKIFIIVEPTTGVDVNSRIIIYNLINELRQEDKSIILITKDNRELELLSNRVLTI